MSLLAQRCPTPLGPLLLVAEDGALIGAWFLGQRHFAPNLPADLPTGEDAALRAARAWVEAYFAGRRPDPAAVPLAPRGTAFQRRVWALLRGIAYGETVTYGELARRLGTSPRAVGGAVGRNPISLIVPCHRVVGADGALTGYAGGLDRKTFLLRLEGCLP